MRRYKLYSLAMILGLSGCAAVDKTLAPVDGAINNTKLLYKKTKNSMNESLTNISNNIDKYKSDYYETGIVKFLTDDEKIIAHREKDFVKWDSGSYYDYKDILKRYIKKHKLQIKYKNLTTTQQMDLLKNYFLAKLEKEYNDKFAQKHKKVTFDKFLTDRENIEKIYKYKMALAQSEHNWNINIEKTKKKVARLMLSTLFGKPKLKFVSYDPYEEEMYFIVKSSYNKFENKIKVKADKKVAKAMQENMYNIAPVMFFKISDKSLQFVGGYLVYKGKKYLANSTEDVYFRDTNLVIVSDKLDLKELNVEYSEVSKNIEPPKWYLNLGDDNIGYGQGYTEEEATNNAYKNIANSKKVTVDTSFSSQKDISGSISTKSLHSKSTIKSDKISLKNTKKIKAQKKDGVWFVAVKYKG